MGLDIVAYFDIKARPELEHVNTEDYFGLVRKGTGKKANVRAYFLNPIRYQSPKFLSRIPEFADLDADLVFSYKDSMGFRAGSYGSYNGWRNELAELAGFEGAQAVWNLEDPQGPCVELIDFSDCEGALGQAVCAKLAQDFKALEHKARLHWGEQGQEFSLGVFQNFLKAFEAVAERGGLVQFC